MSKPVNPIEKFLKRYSLVTFVLLAGIMLTVVIFICYNTYVTATTPEENLAESTIPSSFDTETADKIEKLHQSTDPASMPEPHTDGRINPFIE